MKSVLVLSFVLTTAEIYISTATEILYVLPDNSTSAVSCPSQPCATLSQYVLDNGTLPVVSNVEYHFLPGEHHVPANMILRNLHNSSITGIVSNLSLPVVLLGCLQQYVINIIDSKNVSIKNVTIKHCGISPENKTTKFTNLRIFCCFSCKIQDVTFIQYGLLGYNLIGNSYLHNIKIIQFSQLCCEEILFRYSHCPSQSNYSNYIHNITMKKIFITNKVTLKIHFDHSMYCLNIFLRNSYFYNVSGQALLILGRYSSTIKQIFVTNCIFEFITAEYLAIHFAISPINRNVSFINCEFYHISKKVIEMDIEICKFKTRACELFISNRRFPMIPTNISFIGCQFINNSFRLLFIDNRAPALGKVNVQLRHLNISYNHFTAVTEDHMIFFANINVHIAGIFNVTKNHCRFSIIHFLLCDILLSGKIIFDKNNCAQVIFLDTYIKVMEYTNISFKGNTYQKNVISINEIAEEYQQPFPYCFIQYLAVNDSVKQKYMQRHYSVSFNNNNRRLPTYDHIININGSRLNSQNKSDFVLFCHYMSNCKWLPLGAFYDSDPEIVNQQIVNIDDHNCNYRKHICYCSQYKNANCSSNVLGTVYSGQTLQTILCNMYTNDDNTILYAEVHNINLPNSTCKIAHQSQLINIIGNHSNTVNYTIVSNTPDNSRCKLFLTATPFLNKIYDVFYVKLLPCPIGFTLLNGICDCDPILPASIDKCYIDYSTIRRPANTWLTAPSQTNNTKYLTSECPKDYCLPYSSNVNLLHPDLQCQFNRTGILCSQCQHHLSMVFGSSRCIYGVQ